MRLDPSLISTSSIGGWVPAAGYMASVRRSGILGVSKPRRDEAKPICGFDIVRLNRRLGLVSGWALVQRVNE
jgi:hypothetical protein